MIYGECPHPRTAIARPLNAPRNPDIAVRRACSRDEQAQETYRERLNCAFSELESIGLPKAQEIEIVTFMKGRGAKLLTLLGRRVINAYSDYASGTTLCAYSKTGGYILGQCSAHDQWGVRSMYFLAGGYVGLELPYDAIYYADAKQSFEQRQQIGIYDLDIGPLSDYNFTGHTVKMFEDYAKQLT